jgi:cellulose synthase/poly-beta-1,6-N-acetylglucosamine synthase-like glycosyltransferase
MIVAQAPPTFIRLDGVEPDPFALRILPEEAARQYLAAPLWLEKNELVIACADACDQQRLRELQTICRRPVRAYQVNYPELWDALDRFYRGESKKVQRPGLERILYLLGYLDDSGLEQLAAVQRSANVTPEQAVRRLGLTDEQALAEATGLLFGIPHLRSSGLEPTPELAGLIPWEAAQERRALPLWWLDGVLVVGLAGIEDVDRLAELSQIVGTPVQPIVCPYDLWDRYYRKIYLTGQPNPAKYDQEAIHWLMKTGKLTDLDLQISRAASRQTHRPIASILIERGLISDNDWLRALSHASKTQIETRITDNAAVENLIPLKVARRFKMIPLRVEGDDLVLGMSQPNPEVVKLAQALTRLKVTPRLIPREILEAHLAHLSDRPPREALQTMPSLDNILLRLGLVAPEQMEKVLSHNHALDPRLGTQLVAEGLLDDADMAEALSLQTGLPHIRLDHVRFDEKLIAEIPSRLALEHSMLPIWSGANELWLVIADPLDVAGLRAAEQACGKRVRPVIAPRAAITAALERWVGVQAAGTLLSPAQALTTRLVENGYITHTQATQALNEYVELHMPLDEAIWRSSGLDQAQLVQAYSRLLGLPILHLDLEERLVQVIDPLGKPIERVTVHDPVDLSAATLIDQETAQQLSALPVAFQGDKLRVAFANPLYEAAQTALEKTLKRQIIPALVTRRELKDAIQRHLGRRNIGTYLLMEGLITRAQLNDALGYAQRTGIRLGHALVHRGYVTWEQVYHALAEQSGLPFYGLEEVQIDRQTAQRIDPQAARQNGVLPIGRQDGRILLAVVDPLDNQALDFAHEALGEPITPVLVTENDLDAALDRLYSDHYLARSISELLERSPQDSAYRVLSRGQQIALLIFLVISVAWLLFDYVSYLITINLIFTAFYLSFSTYKFYLIYRALSRDLEVPVTEEDIRKLDDRDLPIYTILIPVYREAEVLVELLNSLRKLDYPQAKLDIKILMEADDQETIQAFYRWNPPSHFHGIIVPYGQPKTKPKACNYGLIHARGDYVVIYDAEDLPEPDQLKKIVVAFSKAPPDVVCIQSKLNYYNRNQNLLTRWFTVEYSMWFDLFLPGLDASGAPIPLGGTSNHFRREALIEVGAWDPYNVTEDADLGIRLYKRGYKTAIVDSTTYEEANSQIYNWIRQRSRWIKGYIQTWLVHMRNPAKLIREIGFKAFLGFQFVIGGTFFAALLNPVYWLLTTLWFLVQWQLIQKIFPGAIFYLGAICLFIGNFAFTYMNVAGALRRGYYGMVKYALLTPLYWGLASIGAWKGFGQLLTRPHFWEKTEHGLYEGVPVTENANTPQPDSVE